MLIDPRDVGFSVGVFMRARKVAVVCGLVLAAGLAGQVPASAAESGGEVGVAEQVVAIERYCGSGGGEAILDPTRSMRFKMFFTGDERNRKYYNAHYLDGRFFKSTGNLC